MKKESKNLGKNTPCPDCKKTLIKSANIIGQGSFQTKCKHCDSVILIEIGQKPFITATKVKIILLLAVIAVGYSVCTLTSIKNTFMAFLTDYNIEIK